MLNIIGRFAAIRLHLPTVRNRVIPFDTKHLPVKIDKVAPDGSEVKVLLVASRAASWQFMNLHQLNFSKEEEK